MVFLGGWKKGADYPHGRTRWQVLSWTLIVAVKTTLGFQQLQSVLLKPSSRKICRLTSEHMLDSLNGDARRFPETLALMEQALRHVLSEQEKLLKRRDASDLTPILKGLCDLALKTTNLIAAGCNRPGSTKHLTGEAKRIETVVDDVSEELWSPIQVSVHAIYERIEQSFQPKSGEFGFAAEVRTHYHNLRIRLLEQMLSARMLASSSDLGDECERIWQQFLERHLGPMFRVLRGGYICDHQGTKSCQIDLIVVLADAQVFVPGDSEDGKAHALIDQIVAAIMVTANLTTKKLTDDWEKLQSLPRYLDFEKDYPQLNGHPWPLCYILAAQSDPTEELQKTWKNHLQRWRHAGGATVRHHIGCRVSLLRTTQMACTALS